VTDYKFDMQLVVDPLNPSNVVANGAVGIYDPSDTLGVSLLTLTDLSGLPLTNPLISNNNGFIAPFVANTPQVRWISGTFEGLFNSYQGLRDEAIAARAAAEAAQGAATTAGAEAAAEASAALAGAVADAEAAAASASAAAAAGEAAQDAAVAAQAAAEDAAAATAGGGFTVDPNNPNVLLISTLDDGTVAVDPSNPNVLLITI
jgi:hypothetical protein